MSRKKRYLLAWATLSVLALGVVWGVRSLKREVQLRRDVAHLQRTFSALRDPSSTVREAWKMELSATNFSGSVRLSQQGSWSDLVALSRSLSRDQIRFMLVHEGIPFNQLTASQRALARSWLNHMRGRPAAEVGFARWPDVLQTEEGLSRVRVYFEPSGGNFWLVFQSRTTLPGHEDRFGTIL